MTHGSGAEEKLLLSVIFGQKSSIPQEHIS